MGILSSLLVTISLALTTHLNLNELSTYILLYCLILITTAKLMAKSLSSYILKFSNISLLKIATGKSSLDTCIECLLLFCVFSSKSLNNAILSNQNAEINSSTLELISHLAASIIVPFSSIALLVVILCGTTSTYKSKAKGLILKELHIVCSSLLLIMGLFLLLENYGIR